MLLVQVAVINRKGRWNAINILILHCKEGKNEVLSKKSDYCLILL